MGKTGRSGRTAALLAGAIMLTAGAATSAAALEEVDVELVLAVDISRSMAMAEQVVQRNGYVEAIASPEVVAAIESGLLGKIAVTYVEWGKAGAERVVIDWQVIDGEASARAFAEKLAAEPLHEVSRTSISEALVFAADQIDTNGYEGLRRVIDVSGDGPNDHGRPVVQARDLAVSRNITVNGLPLILEDGAPRWSVVEDLETYYGQCVIGGVGAFQIPIRRHKDFAAAIRRKLVLEIVGVQPQTRNRVVPAAAFAARDGRDLCTIGERATAQR
ncbi:DUF1194 domain-containing protein [Amorphus orientalis]|uniref:DUF1194 domain-containing protein n=1 Tax=Amorphus orientalis TaxID=649198 RepID=A0AAE4ATP3_9HYPH|nr:DUF1194 domain-containing protein [Amorphus orientalis]MDQ0316528.1 hypothetical protein [Amorphus orientalis]